MKIAIDILPLKSDHKVRGVGFYTQRLISALSKYEKKLEIVEVTDYKNASLVGVELLHIPYFSPFFLTLPFHKKIPLVVTVHDLIPLKYPSHFPPGFRGNLRWQIQKRLLQKVDAIITDSYASARDLVLLAGVDKRRIKVIYLAADEVFRPLTDNFNKKIFSKKYNLPEKFVLYVGDINWNKNVPGLIESCCQLGVPLVIVGKQAVNKSYDPRHPENQDLVTVQSQIEKYPYNPKGGVLPLGFLPTEDLVAVYNLATVYVQPSFDEGFGLPVLEAMSCGCPTIVAKSGSLIEIAGQASKLFNPNCSGELTEAIDNLLNNPAEAKNYRQKGLKWARKFCWQETAKQTLTVYNSIIKS